MFLSFFKLNMFFLCFIKLSVYKKVSIYLNPHYLSICSLLDLYIKNILNIPDTV